MTQLNRQTVRKGRTTSGFATAALSELGYKTALANNATKALAELAERNGGYDAVFTDVVMPSTTGIGMGPQNQRLYPSIPVTPTSGFSDILAQDGTQGFGRFRKPYSIDELSRVLQKMSDNRSRRRTDQVRRGRLGGVPLDLTENEARIERLAHEYGLIRQIPWYRVHPA